MNIQSHPHWPALEKIYTKLVENGHKAYLAGGCVRDALLGLQANDLDLATDATPESIERIFPKTVAVGKSFGVMLVIQDEISFEVATFRSDGLYTDGR
ncbi:MAG: CCA tRNA nucleotidyltransferase, partial [Pseudobdellovibrionaceae bacterium]